MNYQLSKADFVIILKNFEKINKLKASNQNSSFMKFGNNFKRYWTKKLFKNIKKNLNIINFGKIEAVVYVVEESRPGPVAVSKHLRAMIMVKAFLPQGKYCFLFCIAFR
jgi:uncharacterized membrane protein